MSSYELLVILSMNSTDDEKVNFAERVKELINQNGNLVSVDEWGKRVLAYEIKKQKEGFYVLFNFDGKKEFIKELERQLNLDEKVLKYIVVKK